VLTIPQNSIKIRSQFFELFRRTVRPENIGYPSTFLGEGKTVKLVSGVSMDHMRDCNNYGNFCQNQAAFQALFSKHE